MNRLITPRQQEQFNNFWQFYTGETLPPGGYAPTQTQLLGVQPTDVARFLTHKAYGTVSPVADSQAIQRHTTLNTYKSAISTVMPRRLQQWDPVSNTGNPTHSQEVNDVISAVERLQTQGRGIRSQARRDFKFAEVLSLLTAARIAIAGGSGSELYFFLVEVEE